MSASDTAATVQQPNTDFLDEILSFIRGNASSQTAFAMQNTLYAICILLQAAVGNEAIYTKGMVAIDDTVYECKNNILPKSLIDKYGFCAGELLEHGYHEETAKKLFWPTVTLLLEVDAGLIDTIGQRIETELEECGMHNYYGQVLDSAELQGELLAQAKALFGIPVAAAAAAAAEPAAAKKSVKSALLKHTRRMHGRRALTPPRSNRSTAYTRHSKQKTDGAAAEK
jgi:hypothetical protein